MISQQAIFAIPTGIIGAAFQDMVTARADQAKSERENAEMRTVTGDHADDGSRDGLSLGFLPGETGDDDGSLRNVLFGPSTHRTAIFIVTAGWVVYFFVATTPAYASLGSTGEDVRSVCFFCLLRGVHASRRVATGARARSQISATCSAM